MEQASFVQVALQKQYERALFHYSIFIFFFFLPCTEGQKEFPQSALIQCQPGQLTGGRTSPLMSVGELKIMFTFPCLISKQPHMWVLQEPACAQIHKQQTHAWAGSPTQPLLHRQTCICFHYPLFVLHSWVGCSSPLLVNPLETRGLCFVQRGHKHTCCLYETHRKWLEKFGCNF